MRYSISRAQRHLPTTSSDPSRHSQRAARGRDAHSSWRRRDGARFVLASTSEVYGDPLVHPQTETYWGNVNPVGPRSVYDEAKRFAEALTIVWHSTHKLDVGIARIFNTYGPRLRPGDGRVVSNFVSQALEKRSLTVYGDGTQTRSLCYVDDQIEGLIALLDSAVVGPINMGNPYEVTILELAERVIALTGSTSRTEFLPLPEDDPVRRCPDISLARRELGWEPHVDLDDGLTRTIRAFEFEIQSESLEEEAPGPASGADEVRALVSFERGL